MLDHIALAPLPVHGVSRAETEERARGLLERRGLAGQAMASQARLSGGQQRRVALVRALAVRPRLLPLDEITAALDPELVAGVMEMVGA